jgi:hypothetical protein
MGFDLHINLNLSLDVNTGLPFVWGNNLEKKPYVPSDLEVPLKYRKWVRQRGHHFHYYIRSINGSDMLSSTNVEHFLEKYPNVDLLLSHYVIFSRNDSIKLRAVRARNNARQVRRWLDMRGFGGLVESTGMFRKTALNEGLWFDEEMPTTEGLDFVIRWTFQKQVKVYQDILTLYRISENQLHTRQDLVKANVTLVADRYPNLVTNKFVLNRMHLAYFQLSNLRGLRKKEILDLLLPSFMFLNPFVLWMAISIVLRNLKASYLPKKMRGVIMASLK